MRIWPLGVGVLAIALAPGISRAAEQAQDTGKVCRVTTGSAKNIEESLNTAAGVAALAKAIQAQHCQAGDVLETNYSEANPTPIIAQFCDLGRQIHVYNPSSSYTQVGVTPELVCTLIGVRRTNR